MTVVLIASNEDPAGINIKKGLLKLDEWEEYDKFHDNIIYRNTDMKNIYIITINTRTIKHENLDIEISKKTDINPKIAIFITRHRSKSGEPTLTTHPVGNYTEAKYGGRPKTLLKSAPRLMSELLRIINKNAIKHETYHQVCFEVTHHGPYMSIPTLFAEVGSIEEEWRKEKPGEIIAESLLGLFENYHYEKDLPSDIPVLIGVGGGHYAPRFTDVVLEKKSAFGHMIPMYKINQVEDVYELFENAIQNTPDVKYAYLHRKTLKKSQIREYKEWFENKGIPSISSKELEEL